MHNTYLAQVAPLSGALATFVAAHLILFLVTFERRSVQFLLLVLGYLCWCLFFSLLFISSGPAPYLSRPVMVPAIRWSELLGSIGVLLWASLVIRDLWLYYAKHKRFYESEIT